MPAVTIERNGPVWTVILDRPEARNAVDGPDRQGPPPTPSPTFRGRHGAGCGGADRCGRDLLRRRPATSRPWPLRPRKPGYIPRAHAPLGCTRMLLSKPVIAAVEGYAVAGGLELALWCDLRVVARDATFGVFCRRFGVPLVDGGTIRLPRLIGMSRAMDMILTGRAIGGEEARRSALPTGSSRRGRRGSRPSNSPPSWPGCPRPACARTVARRTTRSGWTNAPRWPASSAHGLAVLPEARRRGSPVRRSACRADGGAAAQ